MKILAVSDQVSKYLYRPEIKRLLPTIDLLIGCGDLPIYYLEFLSSAIDRRIYYVHGNHDKAPNQTMKGAELPKVEGGVNLHRRTVMAQDLLLAGLEGSMRYRPRAPYMYTEPEMRAQAVKLMPKLIWNRTKHGRFLDILVAHSPPRHIHDRSDLPHRGFHIFSEMLRLFKPRIMLHGHIHRYRNDEPRVSLYGDTLIVNVYPYIVLDLNDLPDPQQTFTDLPTEK